MTSHKTGEFAEKNKVLVVAAHPDDEILGCGGTMAAYCDRGDDIYVLILGEGVTSRDTRRERESRLREIEALKSECLSANRIIGAKNVFCHDFPDNRFDSVPMLDIVKVVESVKNEIGPDIVFTHFEGDLNMDHQITRQATLTACRPLKGSTVKEIYSFEVPSSTEWSSQGSGFFSPNCYVDVKSTIEKKIAAVNKYKSETRDFPHPRSERAIRMSAQLRGISAGLEFAEAFILIRKIC